MITWRLHWRLLDLVSSIVVEGCRFLDVAGTLVAVEGGLESGSVRSLNTVYIFIF